MTLSHERFYDLIYKIIKENDIWQPNYTTTGWFLYQQTYWKFEQNRILINKGESNDFNEASEHSQ